jgi:dTDP-4-amino-4,6-dideoxygalactose transaminase
VLFESEADLIVTQQQLNQEQINPRRYFYPSLNTIQYVNSTNALEIAESVANRILCLPLYKEINVEELQKICLITNK